MPWRKYLVVHKPVSSSDLTVAFIGPPFLCQLTPLFCHCSLVSITPTSQLSPVTIANHTEVSGLMRLLGVAFPGEKDREEWDKEQEAAKRRDHRRIGTVRRQLNSDTNNGEMLKMLSNGYKLLVYMFLHRIRNCSSSMTSVQAVASFYLKELTSTTHSQISLRWTQ